MRGGSLAVVSCLLSGGQFGCLFICLGYPELRETPAVHTSHVGHTSGDREGQGVQLPGHLHRAVLQEADMWPHVLTFLVLRSRQVSIITLLCKPWPPELAAVWPSVPSPELPGLLATG